MKTAILVPFVLAAALSAQRTIVVQGGGAALQQAIDQAAPGDTLDVHAGSYGAVRVAKGITIACRSGVEVRGSATYCLHVDGVPQGETAQVIGGRYPAGTLLAGGSVAVTGCAGTVVLEGIVPETPVFTLNSLRIDANTGPVLCRHIDVGTQDYFLRPAAISGSAQVSFSDCPNLPPLGVGSSNVSLAACGIAARNASIGLALGSGSVSIAGGVTVGSFEFSAGNPLPAIRVSGGALTIAGPAQVVAGRFAPLWAPAIDLRGGSLRIAPSVTLTTGHATPISGTGTWSQVPVPSVAVDGVAPGGALSVDVRGRAGSLTATFVDVPRAAPQATPFGELWILPTSPVFALATLPPSGRVVFAGTVPASVPLGLPLTFQPISLLANGRIVAGTPARTVLR